MARNEQPQSQRRARPQSTLAQNFSAALDDMFKLDGLGALELSVEEKKEDVQIKQLQLDDLEVKLRQATERLKKLEAKHRRQSQSQNMLGSSSGRPAVRTVRPVSEESQATDDSGGDSRSEDDKRVSR